ncbi:MULTISPECIES: glycosyltransferase [unclassified Agarivorans]|nr:MULTISPECIES: glycosyltransferase [unclassified Agarivorans]MDO6686284.1 glycosyltransferase [Agarivorans sp. 3_MG-2023]MDO6716267.1 glycosyltransferase [Agarivorans sp. 2_MG-2023]
MKIVHLTTNFALTGGAERMLANLVNNLPQHQHIIIALMSVSEQNKALIKDHSQVEFISLNARGPLGMLFSLFKLSGLLKNRTVSLIQCWMYHANAIGGLYKYLSQVSTPLYFGIHHSLDKLEDEKRSTRLALWLGKLTQCKANKILCCSQRSVSQHINYGYSAEKLQFIANGYDFSAASLKPQSKEVLNIGTAGRWHPAKDYPIFFAAVAPLLDKYPSLTLRVAGRDMATANVSLMGLLNDLDIPLARVELLGELNDIASFYRSLDLFVLPSKTEGFPNVLVEAMSQGLPCVTTDVGDAAFILNHAEWVVKPQQSALLSEAVSMMLASPQEERQTIANSNYHRVTKEFDIADISQQYLDVYQRGGC